MNRLLRALAVAPYTAYLLFVLFPAGAVAYALAALARTIYTNAKSGWRDHS